MTNILKNLEIYGFSGKMGTGKNFIAENLFRYMLPPKNTLVVALADHFKVDCISKDNVAYHRVFGEKDQQTRKLLQKRGTEEGRNVYGKNIWIETLETWIRRHHETGVERVIITDLRYKNEVEWVNQIGGMTFRIIAPERNRSRLEAESVGDPDKMDRIANHDSEIELDGCEDLFDFVIHNDYSDQPKVANQIRDVIRKVIYKDPVELTIFCDLDDTICKCKVFYQKIIDQVLDIIRKQVGNLTKDQMNTLLRKHIESFETRYYTRDDFSNSLVNMVTEAFLLKNNVMKLDSKVIQYVYDLGNTVYDENYTQLNPDTIDYLRRLKHLGQVVIFTLGDHTEQMKKIVGLGLTDFKIEICTHKDANMFRYLKNKYPSINYVMIGDSINRDLIPAGEAEITSRVLISEKPYKNGNNYEFHTKKLNDELISYIQNITK